MNVFVTGAGGFVGRTLLAKLIAAGHSATALLLEGESAEGLDPAARLVRGDITQPASLRGVMDDHDAVVHLAGAVGYGQQWSRCVEVNVEGTRNIAEEAVRAGARRFVHMSSVSVYGRLPEVALTEDAPLLKTDDPYGDTKIDAEEVVRQVGGGGTLQWTILRPTVIYGAGDDKFLPKLVQNLRSGSARIIGSGAATVDLVHVDDVVAFIEALLSDARSHGEALNLADPDTCSWQELLGVVADELRVPRPSKRLPYHAALLVAGAMELVARLTGRPPRLTRYAVRVVGRQYRYVATRAQELGFSCSVPPDRGIVGVMRSSTR